MLRMFARLKSFRTFLPSPFTSPRPLYRLPHSNTADFFIATSLYAALSISKDLLPLLPNLTQNLILIWVKQKKRAFATDAIVLQVRT